jgi:hypothetical protein
LHFCQNQAFATKTVAGSSDWFFLQQEEKGEHKKGIAIIPFVYCMQVFPDAEIRKILPNNFPEQYSAGQIPTQ